MTLPHADHSCRRPWLAALLAAVAALAVYAVALRADFIYDDVVLILETPRVHDPHLWREIWTQGYQPTAADNLYRPLVTLSYAVQWWIHGPSRLGYHLFNILLHAGVAAAVAELARRLAGFRAACIAGFLFAVHPVHSEAVIGIVGRCELGCTLASLGALLIFLGKPLTQTRALLIALLGTVAILCKEQGLFIIPLLLAALPLRRRIVTKPDQYQSVLLTFALLMLATAAFALIRNYGLGLKFYWPRDFMIYTWAIQPLVLSTGMNRITVPIALLGRYVALLVAPVHLSIDWGWRVIGPTSGLGDPYFLLGAAVLLGGLAGVFIALRRRAWTVLFCLLGFAITYAMVSNFILIGTIFAERLIYFPSLFFILLIAMGLARLPVKFGGVLAAILILLASVRTIAYASHWSDRDSFYAYQVRVQPRSLMVYQLAIHRALVEHRTADARELAKRLIQIDDHYWRSWGAADMVEEQAGNWPLAIQYARRAFELDPNPLSANNLMALQAKARSPKSARVDDEP